MATATPSSDPDLLVKVEQVGKKFCRDLRKSLWYGLKDVACELMPRKGSAQRQTVLRPEEFWAVDDVSFAVRRGDCLGLMGRNGAGKTTLLKMLNGLIKPDRGRIEMRGRVGAVIALGSGFNPLLTGRENVYVNASVLGLSRKETDRRFQEIVDFAGIGEFIDSPVQSYSSGMQVRLGFAVATALEPDILILDEVLAVGDAAFRAKCYNRIGKMRQKAAVIFVSHSMQQVAQISTSTLLLDKGRTLWLGDVEEGIAAYDAQNGSDAEEGEKLLFTEHPVHCASLEFTPSCVDYSQCVTARLEIVLEHAMPDSCIRIPFYNPEGVVVADWNSKRSGVRIDLKEGPNLCVIQLGPMHLAPGAYHMGFVLNDATGVFMPFWSLKQHRIEVSGCRAGQSPYRVPHHEVVVQAL